jgi:hypothetical protein
MLKSVNGSALPTGGATQQPAAELGDAREPKEEPPVVTEAGARCTSGACSLV